MSSKLDDAIAVLIAHANEGREIYLSYLKKVNLIRNELK